MPKVIGFDDAVKRKATCKACGAINEYLKADVGSYTAHDYGGGSDTYHEIKCANEACAEKISVKAWY